ncbi:glycosyltransferase [Pseudonocardia sp. K10HN5]|uniref:Glycosyltransferase n=1 Tax=Pseudonocardia acidicola TaxID=2724939 RepID=A0ABX1SEU4_9PSEU|nr:glycosyltransferase [Pseudonocardia acidicola]
MFDNASGHLPLETVSHTSPPELTVVVPTRNESGNIGPLLDRVKAAAGPRRIEVLFVDDSDDDTPEKVLARSLAERLPVRLLHRERGDRTGGLGGAVVAGLREARADWAVVMDGDLQHPPELALRLAGVGRSRDLDLVAASRHVGGGDAGGLGTTTRHAVSGGATAVAKTMFPRRLAQLSDPMSGMFALRTAAIDLDRLEPHGFKILMEIVVRNPRLRVAEVPFSMQPRHTGQSKASLAEGARFTGHLARLRLAVLARQVARSAESAGPRQWLLRAFLFGLVGASGLLVNTAVLMLLGIQAPRLHYLIAAVLATEASTAWLFLLTERLVFPGAKPGTRRGRAVRFFLLNHIALLARLPLLALLVEALGMNVVWANLITLLLLFAVRFLVADAAIYGTAAAAAPPREPMKIVVDVSVPPDGAAADTAPAPTPRVAAPRTAARPGQRYLPYRYEIPDVATVGSQVRLPELEYFRAQYLGHDTDIQVRIQPTGTAMPRTRATMTQTTTPPSVAYSEHLGRLGANFHVQLGEPIVVTVAPPLAHSPHVVYTNILEALLRFVAVSRGVMLLHSACLELDGLGMLISAETDTGKTGTVLRLVRERGARFLSDDMTILHPDGRVGCFPKPLTISHHTLRAVGSDELSRREWRRLQLQSRLHSKEGRQFAMLLSRLNIPIMGVNALTQRLVPPPKYTVDRLLPCTIVPSTVVSELFLISRGAHGAGELSRADAMRNLLANTEDAYQFPPFRQLAPSVVIGADDHLALRRKEHAILASALDGLRCRWISTPDFTWADEIPRALGAPAVAAARAG